VKLGRNIVATVAARLVLLGVALASSVVLARSLGPDGRGLFALVLLVPELVRSLGLLGFEQANVVYAGLEPSKKQALVWQSIVMAGVLGGIGAVTGICFFWLGGPGSKALVHGPLWLYLLPMSLVPALLLIEYWLAILRGMDRIMLLNAIEVGTKATSVGLLLVFVWWLQLDVAGAVWIHTLIVGGTVLLLLFCLRRLGVCGRPSFDRSLWGRTTRFAVPSHAGTLAAYLNYRIDEFFIAALLPPAQLGFYVIAVGLAERIWLIPSSVTIALLPHRMNAGSCDAALPAVVARHVMLWVGSACLMLFLIAEIIIRFLYSPEFMEAVAPFRWLLPGICALSVGKVLVTELLAREKPGYTVWASGLAALVNVAGNLVLIPRMGISGAALASSISYTVLSITLIAFYLRETGLQWTVLVPRPADLRSYSSLWREGGGLSLLGLTGTRGARV